ncbi:DUF1524 domain-containing protein [Streptomyces sp. NPDC046261]|uniref:GmrSD restriction endonuclease domain-containing protein n=1 Tax=Streptomyces sp. NPDC046261 TaxID=3157200 RepID=UPI0033DB6B5F
MRPEKIVTRRHRLTLPSAITVALAISGTALPGAAAFAAPQLGPAPAHQRHTASPADYDETDCEGPAEGDGDVYTRPPVTGQPTKEEDAEQPKGKPPQDRPKGRPARDADHAKTPQAKEPDHPKAEPARKPEQPKAQPAKEPGHPKAPAAQKPGARPAPSGVRPASHRGLPLKWPKNIPDRDDAARMLDELEVRTFNSKGYDRRHFGGAACWVRHGVNRCTTREMALKIQSIVPARLEGKCKVVGGQWHSEYDNRTMNDPLHVDVDHIVPLRHAWGSGASSWPAAKRQEFANDLTASPQLIVVSTWSNRRKGDKAPDKWMPSGGECMYSRAWIAVKDYYGLSVTEAEKDKLRQVLGKCD